MRIQLILYMNNWFNFRADLIRYLAKPIYNPLNMDGLHWSRAPPVFETSSNIHLQSIRWIYLLVFKPLRDQSILELNCICIVKPFSTLRLLGKLPTIRARLSILVNSQTADGLTTLGTKSIDPMLLTLLSRYISTRQQNCYTSKYLVDSFNKNIKLQEYHGLKKGSGWYSWS